MAGECSPVGPHHTTRPGEKVMVISLWPPSGWQQLMELISSPSLPSSLPPSLPPSSFSPHCLPPFLPSTPQKKNPYCPHICTLHHQHKTIMCTHMCTHMCTYTYTPVVVVKKYDTAMKHHMYIKPYSTLHPLIGARVACTPTCTYIVCISGDLRSLIW